MINFCMIVFQGYDQSVDWWCLGAVLYEMLYGLPPFYSRNTSEMYDRIVNKPLRLRPTISESARDILAKVPEQTIFLLVVIVPVT